MKIKDLYFAYDKEYVIKGVSFEIKKGKITTFMGSNGCGKSTLFKLLTKNLKPTYGQITIDEKNIYKINIKEFAQKVAIVHQYNKSPKDLKVGQLVSYGRLPFIKKFHSANEEDEKIVQWALEETNLSSMKKIDMGKLSGGQRQRAWIGMSLAQKPQILFLDEPTTYLDIRYQIEILRLIKKLNQKYNMTIVIVLHDINQAINISDEVIGMKDGKILFQGSPQNVITNKTIKQLYDVELEVEQFNNKKYVLAV